MPSNRPRPGDESDKGQGPKGPKDTKKTGNTSASRARFIERQARKEEAQRDARRRRNQRYAIFSIALVVLIVGVLVIVKVVGGGSGASSDQTSPPAGTPVPAATLAKIDSVPLSTLHSAPTAGLLPSIQTVKSSALRAEGKPELLFIGAEWCPHCAAERWAIYTALSKFGTFTPPPGRIHSAPDDGDIQTLTFYGTTYSSPYFTFVPVEVYTNHPTANGYEALQTPTTAELKLWNAANGESFPFLDFGGSPVVSGAQYSYAALQGLSFSEVAAQIGDNSTTAGADIDASANQLIKTICGSLSAGQPAAVCSS